MYVTEIALSVLFGVGLTGIAAASKRVRSQAAKSDRVWWPGALGWYGNGPT